MRVLELCAILTASSVASPCVAVRIRIAWPHGHAAIFQSPSPRRSRPVQQRLTLYFGEPTPEPVRLARLDSVSETLAADGAAGTDCLCCSFSIAAHGLALPMRMEEQLGAAPAPGSDLPIPAPGLSAGRTSGPDDVGHGGLLERLGGTASASTTACRTSSEDAMSRDTGQVRVVIAARAHRTCTAPGRRRVRQQVLRPRQGPGPRSPSTGRTSASGPRSTRSRTRRGSRSRIGPTRQHAAAPLEPERPPRDSSRPVT